MEFVGWIALIILLAYFAYPGKVKKLESKVRKLEGKQGGVNSMSKIINELIEKTCKIKTEESWGGSADIQGMILAVDDEWIKFAYKDKKDVEKIKILRIDSINNIELIDK